MLSVKHSAHINKYIISWISGWSNNALHFQEDFASYEANEPFVQNLIMNLEGLLGVFRGSLTTSNYDTLVSILASEVTTHLEKVVMKSTFNRVNIDSTETYSIFRHIAMSWQHPLFFSYVNLSCFSIYVSVTCGSFKEFWGNSQWLQSVCLPQDCCCICFCFGVSTEVSKSRLTYA